MLNLGMRWGRLGNATPRPLYPMLDDPVPIVQDRGWDPRQLYMGTKNPAPIRVRTPHRPARSCRYTDYPTLPPLIFDSGIFL